MVIFYLVFEWKTAPVELKKLNDAMHNRVVKNKKFNTLNNLEKKIPPATTLIDINQYNTDKQNLDKKIWRSWSKNTRRGLLTTTFLNTKIREFGNKIPDATSIVTTTVINTEVGEADTKIPDHAKYITTQEFNNLNTENFAARLKQDNLMSKTDFNNKLTKVNRKIISNTRKYLELQKT